MLRTGSSWRRWDLHVHAPSAALNNQFAGSTIDEKWTMYLDALETIGEYGCLGITDYFSIDGYLKVREHKATGALKNVAMLLPNIELRIVPVTDKNKAINLHVLASPGIADQLNDLLFINLKFQYRDQSYPCTRTGLVNLGRTFRDDPMLAEDAAYRAGVGQFKIELSNLRECLAANSSLRRNILIAIANGHHDGNSGIKDSGLKALRQELYKFADCVFSSNPNDRAYFIGAGAMSTEDVKKEYGSLKACIHGCDAHDLEKLGKPDLDRFTWIKADTTFEGLKQICHEPDGRVYIGQFPPATPVHRIASARLSFPPGSQLRWGAEEQPFCFRGETQLAFAPGLTCVIGGRGAGKSTLLNLLHERLATGKNDYFSDRIPKHEGETLSISACVDIEYHGEQSAVEFISQNHVEQFALEPQRLTQAILSRLLAHDTNDVVGGLSVLDEARDALRKRAELVAKEAAVEGQIADNAAALASLNALVSSFEDPEYVLISKAVQDCSARLRALKSDRMALHTAVDQVGKAVEEATVPTWDNDYTRLMRAFVDEVRLAIARVKNTLDPSAPEPPRVRRRLGGLSIQAAASAA